MTDPEAADPTALKHQVRRQARRLRARAGVTAEIALQVRDRVLAAVPLPDGATVGGYWPMGAELDVMPLLAALAGRDHPVALPVVTAPAAPLAFRAWTPGAPLVEGAYGIPMPLETAPWLEPRVLLVPLLAFDRDGFRLGQGGGFYDRTLAALRADGGGGVLAVGVALAVQEVAAVPRGPHDQPLDWIVTERAALKIG